MHLSESRTPRTRSIGDGMPPCSVCPSEADRASNNVPPSSCNIFVINVVVYTLDDASLLQNMYHGQSNCKKRVQPYLSTNRPSLRPGGSKVYLVFKNCTSLFSMSRLIPSSGVYTILAPTWVGGMIRTKTQENDRAYRQCPHSCKIPALAAIHLNNEHSVTARTCTLLNRIACIH